MRRTSLLGRLGLAFVAITIVVLSAERTIAQSAPAMELLDEFITMEAERESGRKQTETSPAADASTELVERSSVSDLIGIGANLAGLSVGSGDEEEADSAAATVSLASFTALINGTTPRDDAYYSDPMNRFLRNSAITLGYDDPKDGTAGRATLIGAKLRFYADARRNDSGDFLPAVFMARPATSLLRPECSPLLGKEETCWQEAGPPDEPLTLEQSSLTSPRAWRDWERKQIRTLRAAARSADARATDDERWGAVLCRNGFELDRGTPRTNPAVEDLRADPAEPIVGLIEVPNDGTRLGDVPDQKVATVEEFFPSLTIVGRPGRLAEAVSKAGGYIGWLTCTGDGDFVAQVADTAAFQAASGAGANDVERSLEAMIRCGKAARG